LGRGEGESEVRREKKEKGREERGKRKKQGREREEFCALVIFFFRRNPVIKMLPYILLKNIFIFYHSKWPAQGTRTVPTVSTHFCSLFVHCRDVTPFCLPHSTCTYCKNRSSGSALTFKRFITHAYYGSA